MFESGFDFDLPTLVNGAIKVAVILVIALVMVVVLRKLIPKIITARIPKIREEAPEELASRAKTLAHVATRFVAVAIWTVALVMILSVVGVDITPLLASLGVAALALGFAAQNIIRDYLHGFFILIEDWYRIGEWVTISGMEGDVEQLSLRRTVLREPNGTLHMIPNSQVAVASNQTRDWSRINLRVSVAYKEDIDRVISVINDVGRRFKEDAEWSEKLTSAPAVTRVSDLGDHGVEILIRGYTKPGEQWALTGELRRRIKNRFDEEGIEIPWPHTKVYFGNKLEKGG